MNMIKISRLAIRKFPISIKSIFM